MPRTITEIRRQDRDRKRAERSSIRALGIPTPAQANAAIVEACAFAAASSVNIEAAKAGRQPVIEVRHILSAAHKILSIRLGLDSHQSTHALLKALTPRPEHRWPSHVPSHHVAPPPAGD